LPPSTGVFPSSGSTIFASVLGIGTPIVFTFGRLNGLTWVTGEASVNPKPSRIVDPVIFSNRRITSSGRGADPDTQATSELKSWSDAPGIWAVSREERSQHRNRERALARLREKLEARRKKAKPRVKTKVPRAAKARRRESKRKRGETKRLRKKPDTEE
jgi:hypothetical protein